MSWIKLIYLGYLTKKSDVFLTKLPWTKHVLQCNAMSLKHFSLKAAAQKKIKYTLVKIFMELHLGSAVSWQGTSVNNHCVQHEIWIAYTDIILICFFGLLIKQYSTVPKLYIDKLK